MKAKNYAKTAFHKDEKFQNEAGNTFRPDKVFSVEWHYN